MDSEHKWSATAWCYSDSPVTAENVAGKSPILGDYQVSIVSKQLKNEAGSMSGSAQYQIDFEIEGHSPYEIPYSSPEADYLQKELEVIAVQLRIQGAGVLRPMVNQVQFSNRSGLHLRVMLLGYTAKEVILDSGSQKFGDRKIKSELLLNLLTPMFPIDGISEFLSLYSVLYLYFEEEAFASGAKDFRQSNFNEILSEKGENAHMEPLRPRNDERFKWESENLPVPQTDKLAPAHTNVRNTLLHPYNNQEFEEAKKRVPLLLPSLRQIVFDIATEPA